jgi:hypothetical protein
MASIAVPQVQISLVSTRILELKRQIHHKADRNEVSHHLPHFYVFDSIYRTLPLWRK